jgi:outer membrane biosynthesis protein TonB
MKARNNVSVVLLFTAVFAHAWADSNEKLNKPLNDDAIRIVEFHNLEYPLLARSSGTGDTVVVKVKLDKLGRVLDATALSGRGVFVADSLANVKKWRFQPNEDNAAVVIYSFRRVNGVCNLASSFFTLERPNLAVISACWPAAKASKVNVSETSHDATVEDRDITVRDFQDMKYPNLALSARVSGIVVVQAKLDADGKVVESAAISGSGTLIPACLANLDKWRFKPNAKRSVIVVYRFKLPCSGTDYESESQNQFVVEGSTFVTITATPKSAQP